MVALRSFRPEINSGLKDLSFLTRYRLGYEVGCRQQWVYFCDLWNKDDSNIAVAVLCIFCSWKLTVMPYMKTVQQISWGMGELKLLKHTLTDAMLSNCLWALMLTCVCCVLKQKGDRNLRSRFELTGNKNVNPGIGNSTCVLGATNTYVLTERSRVLLEKLTGFQLVKKFPTFQGTRRFITALTSARHLSLSKAHSIQSIPPHSTFWRSVLILFSHLHLVLPSGLFPSSFPNKTPVYASPLPHTRYMSSPSHSSLFYHPNNMRWAVQIIKLLITQFCPLPCYLFPVRPKYFIQHPVFKHPQSTFLPQCERPSFTPIQNNRHNYRILCI